MGAQSILVVEDEVLIRLLMAEALRDEGYQIVEAATADEGMAVLQSGQAIDLIITDVRMPGQIDGLQLAAQAKRYDPNRPVIIVSGHLTAQDVSRVDAFIPKPYTYVHLLSVVNQLIGPPCRNGHQNRTA
jgi:CheY-like chemotaxis protein